MLKIIYIVIIILSFKILNTQRWYKNIWMDCICVLNFILLSWRIIKKRLWLFYRVNINCTINRNWCKYSLFIQPISFLFQFTHLFKLFLIIRAFRKEWNDWLMMVFEWLYAISRHYIKNNKNIVYMCLVILSAVVFLFINFLLYFLNASNKNYTRNRIQKMKWRSCYICNYFDIIIENVII